MTSVQNTRHLHNSNSLLQHTQEAFLKKLRKNLPYKRILRKLIKKILRNKIPA
jgi:hypothetical protein